jgi:biopolymer transport protein ExbB
MSFADILAQIVGFLELGGPVVAIIGALSVAALAIILIKLVQFALEGVGRRRRAERAVYLWVHGRRAEARQLVSDARGPTGASVAVAMATAERANTDKSLAEDEVGRIAAIRLHRLGRGLRPLDTIAQIAPLLGLFGTVLGMIEAFQKLQGAGNAVDPSLLAGGIWVALMTTAAGLALAMPVSIVVTFFEGMIDNERMAIESLSSAVLIDSALNAGDLHEAAFDAGDTVSPVKRLVHAH